jgi:hypothetical protein
MKFLNYSSWSRRKDIVRALLGAFRIDTPQSAFAKLAPPALGFVTALLFPVDSYWGKFGAGAMAWVLVVVIMYLWTSRILPESSKPLFGLSPLYTAQGRRQFRAEQLAIKRRLDQLSSQSALIAAEMAKLDLTTSEGQEQLRRLSQKKAQIDPDLAQLRSSVGYIGYTPL